LDIISKNKDLSIELKAFEKSKVAIERFPEFLSEAKKRFAE
jgi:hypothetical protein